MKARPLFVNRARRLLTKRYGAVMSIALGPRWDDDWIDEAACIVDDLAAAAGLTEAQWDQRSGRAFDLFTTNRRFDPGRWTRYIHAVALHLQARAGE